MICKNIFLESDDWMFKPTKEAIGEISPVLHKAQPAINPIWSMRNFENKISFF